MRSAPFAVGEARADLRVLLEPGSGVQIDLRHLGGPPLALAVRIPVPHDAALARVYLDWDELEETGGAVRVSLSAEHPEISLWAELVPHRAAFSKTLPAALPAGFAGSGIRLAAGASQRWKHLTAALARLLDLPLLPPAAPGGMVRSLHPLELSPREPGELRSLVSSAERFLIHARTLRTGERPTESAPPR